MLLCVPLLDQESPVGMARGITTWMSSAEPLAQSGHLGNAHLLNLENIPVITRRIINGNFRNLVFLEMRS